MTTFQAEAILRELKPFQRDTVEYVFNRFFGTDPVDRFLVADEVGLGKTLVARGVIAKLIERHLREPGRRIDIIYICSNQAIAQQNFSKLAVIGREHRAVTDRITTLPLHTHGLNEKHPDYDRGINIVPITPSTSLDLRSSVGRADERALLWWLLTDERLLGTRKMRHKGAERLFEPPIRHPGGFKERLAEIRPSEIDPDLWGKFAERLRRSELLGEVDRLIELFRSSSRANQNGRSRTHVVAELRHELADACVEALEPDLVILDEFQRFPRLLEEDQKTGRLAHRLFAYPGCKSLLLSATPYRMFSRSQELDDDHYRDFLGTVDFLFDDEQKGARLRTAMAEYRTALSAGEIVDDGREIAAARDAIRAELIRVMCRTERLGAAGDRNGMLAACPERALEPALSTADLRGYADFDRVASSLGVRDVVEFWKAAPYPLNLMDDYALTRAFEARARSGARLPVEVRIDPEAARRYGEIDPGNARLRGLIRRLEEEDAWKCLWLPPSLPYYAAGPPYDRVDVATKRLIFSRWQVVPKAIAALASFQMDRRIYGSLPAAEIENSAEGRKSLGQPFQWRADGRLTELLAALPARELASLTDPLVLAKELGSAAGPAARGAVLDAAERNVREAVRALDLPSTRGLADPLWYSVVALRLDERAQPRSVAAWLREDGLGVEDGHRAAWVDHVRRLRRALESDEELGALPKDLARVLAHVGVGGPGPCVLRALQRSFDAIDAAELGSAALRSANALRLLLNLPESVAVVRGNAPARSRLRKSREGAHWRAALDYCVNGNLQAVLDEYVHTLSEWAGGTGDSSRLAAVTRTAGEAMGIGAASLRGRTILTDGAVDQNRPLAFHSRIAVRLDRGEGEDEKSVRRVDAVRKAFNSPFWPFVVATTSIGQEGLDFHLYSHAVIHWNLPYNPVDLEQREGRVHRFKNHAVRRNLAAAHRVDGIGAAPDDPWGAMFAAAPEEAGGLHPYWVFPGRARIERHVPFEPLSIDRQRLDELTTLMGIYRLAFGQPRQEEFVAVLRGLGVDSDRAAGFAVDLAPPGAPA